MDPPRFPSHIIQEGFSVTATVPFLYYTRSKKFSPKNEKDLGMACHILPLKKVKKQGEMPLPSLGHP